MGSAGSDLVTHGKHNFRAGFGWEKNIADSADQEVTRGDMVFPALKISAGDGAAQNVEV